MKLSKKLASIGLAVAMVASIGATSVFASESIEHNNESASSNSRHSQTNDFKVYSQPGVDSYSASGTKYNTSPTATIHVETVRNSAKIYYRITADQSVNTFITETKNINIPYIFTLNYYNGENTRRNATLRSYQSATDVVGGMQTGGLTF